MEARKLPERLENPIDNLLYRGVYVLHPVFKSLNFTANGITILSAITQTIGVLCIYKSYFAVGGILYLIGYFFDVMDGWYARKYKMTSSYGDKLDHYSDIIVHVLLYAAVIFHPSLTIGVKALWFFSTIALSLLTLVHMACQEQYYNKGKPSGTTLDTLRPLCKNNGEEMMKFTRWVGAGTLNGYVMAFFVILSVVYAQQNSRS